MSQPKNLASSIQNRLQNQARVRGQVYNELLQYYAMERFLYRLSQSNYRQKFVLKGALVFLAWGAPLTRPTKDIDLLGFTANKLETLVEIMQEVCAAEVEPDGVTFYPNSITAERIKEDADYEGARIFIHGALGKARLHLQIDIGFADVVSPAPILVHYPSILSQPAPQLRGYPPETVVAEKFHAMVLLGSLNSRMKDFYDLWILAHQFEFEGCLLQSAIISTFQRRGTLIPTEAPTALTEPFAKEKQLMWQAFLKRNRIENAPPLFMDVISVLQALLLQPLALISEGKTNEQIWQIQGKWLGKSIESKK